MTRATGGSDRAGYQVSLATKLSEPVLRSLPCVRAVDVPESTIFELDADRVNEVMERLTAQGYVPLHIRVIFRQDDPSSQ
jgi:hypothetical protein